MKKEDEEETSSLRKWQKQRKRKENINCVVLKFWSVVHDVFHVMYVLVFGRESCFLCLIEDAQTLVMSLAE